MPALCAQLPTREKTRRRGRWLAVLFGPFGCTLRWLLSKTNYTLPGEYNWLPVGTLAANMLACTINFFIWVGALALSLALRSA